MPDPSESISNQFNNSSYRLEKSSGTIKIISKVDSTIYTIVTLLVGMVAIVIASLEVLAFILLLFPLILFVILFERKKFPTRIIFNSSEKSLALFTNDLMSTKLQFDDIEDMVLERIIENTSASPFKESNKKFVYSFMVLDRSDMKHKMIKFESYKNMDEEMRELAIFFNDLTES